MSTEKGRKRSAGSKKSPIRRKKQKTSSKPKPEFRPGGRYEHVTIRRKKQKASSKPKPEFRPGGRYEHVTTRRKKQKASSRSEHRVAIRRKSRKPLSRSKPQFGPGGRLQNVTSRSLNYKDQRGRVARRGGSEMKRIKSASKLERAVRKWLIKSTEDIELEELLKKAEVKKSVRAKKSPEKYSFPLNLPPFRFGPTAKKPERKIKKKVSKSPSKKSPPRKRRPSVHKRSKAMMVLPKPRRGSVHKRKPALMRLPNVL